MYAWSTYGALCCWSADDNGRNGEAFERSLAIEPIEAVLSNLGTIDYQRGTTLRPRAYYQQAAELNPGAFPAYGATSATHCCAIPPRRRRDRPIAEAASWRSATSTSSPTTPHAVAIAGWYRANLGEADAARELRSARRRAGRGTAEVAYYNAETLLLLGAGPRPRASDRGGACGGHR